MSEPDDVERFNVPLAYIGDLELTYDVVFASRYDALAADLAAARTEIERLTKELEHMAAVKDIHQRKRREYFERAEKAEAARPQRWLQSMLADAERDMRQRAADTAREAWRDGYDAAPHILALPLKHADREGGV